MEPISHLILSGGGLSGFKTIGILKYLGENKMLSSLKNIHCVSVGSIIGLLLLADIHESVFVPAFIEAHNIFIKTWNIKNIFKTCSLFDHNAYVRTAISLASPVFGEEPTFESVYNSTNIVFTVVGSDIATSKPVYFSVHTTPSMSIETALNISCGIPIVYPCTTINDSVYVDGSLLDHFPIEHAVAGTDGPAPTNVFGVNIINATAADVDSRSGISIHTFVRMCISAVVNKYCCKRVHRPNVLNVETIITNDHLFKPFLDDSVLYNAIQAGYTECYEHFRNITS